MGAEKTGIYPQFTIDLKPYMRFHDIIIRSGSPGAIGKIAIAKNGGSSYFIRIILNRQLGNIE